MVRVPGPFRKPGRFQENMNNRFLDFIGLIAYIYLGCLVVDALKAYIACH
jgi:hypothetical protein